MPGTDFYEEIKAGVKEAIKELGRAGMLSDTLAETTPSRTDTRTREG
jgi:hypothetical protein